MKTGFGQRLREVRGSHSLATWAAMIGSNKSSWAQYEAEQTFPSSELLFRLQELVGADLNWLGNGERVSRGPLDQSVLKSALTAVEMEVPNIDAESKVKMVILLYNEFTKAKDVHREAEGAKKIAS